MKVTLCTILICMFVAVTLALPEGQNGLQTDLEMEMMGQGLLEEKTMHKRQVRRRSARVRGVARSRLRPTIGRSLTARRRFLPIRRRLPLIRRFVRTGRPFLPFRFRFAPFRRRFVPVKETIIEEEEVTAVDYDEFDEPLD